MCIVTICMLSHARDRSLFLCLLRLALEVGGLHCLPLVVAIPTLPGGLLNYFHPHL
jgi:hypothetical protein